MPAFLGQDSGDSEENAETLSVHCTHLLFANGFKLKLHGGEHRESDLAAAERAPVCAVSYVQMSAKKPPLSNPKTTASPRPPTGSQPKPSPRTSLPIGLLSLVFYRWLASN